MMIKALVLSASDGHHDMPVTRVTVKCAVITHATTWEIAAAVACSLHISMLCCGQGMPLCLRQSVIAVTLWLLIAHRLIGHLMCVCTLSIISVVCITWLISCVMSQVISVFFNIAFGCVTRASKFTVSASSSYAEGQATCIV